MSKSGRGRDEKASKKRESIKQQADTDSAIIRQQLTMGGSSQTSLNGATKTIGESPLGPIRMSYLGTYNRVVLLAIDASPAAKYAFQCE